MPRSHVLVVAGALAICLIAGSPQRLVGVGGEFLALAINFASLHGPALRPADIPAIQSRIAEFDPQLARWDIWGSTVGNATRGRDFVHFWFYALLAAPGLWVTNTVGAPPTLAFAAVNLALLGLGLWIALPRIGSAACLLLFAGPIVWWLDKAHTEAFTFSLLTVTCLLVTERPVWSMIAAGAAATQNPPIAVLVPLVFAAAVARQKSARTDRRVLAGAAGALALALLHPVYSYVRHGTPTLLLGATTSEIPTFARLSAVVLDPTVGLIGNYPIFLLVVGVTLIALGRYRARVFWSPELLVVGIATGVFLLSFARTTNVHHGATPSLSRYALWLIPLSVPLFAVMRDRGGTNWQRFLWTAATVSALVSVFAFHPAVPQNSREPTWLAEFLWTRFPSWNNPLPEVFVETELHTEVPAVPAATAGCEKVLVAGRDNDAAVWPVPCYPAPLPEGCRRTGEMCYANLIDHQYEFARVPGTWRGGGELRLDAVWPADTLPHVRRLYESWNWPSLHFGPPGLSILRQAVAVTVTAIGSDERFILVLRDIRPAALVRFRPRSPMSGILIDARTGHTLRVEESRGPAGEPWDVTLPRGFDTLLLAMRPTN
jgi:hypothetical protein